MTAVIWVGVVAIGGVSAVVRFVVDRAVSGRIVRAFPVGTLTVNLSGAMVLGFLSGLAQLLHRRQRQPSHMRRSSRNLLAPKSQRCLDEADEIAHLLDRLVGGLLPRVVVAVLASEVLEGVGVARRQVWYQVFPVDVADNVAVEEGVRGAGIGELR